MNVPFPPPPAAPIKPRRKIWPWALGGCLLVLLIGVVTVGALIYFGAKAIAAGSREVVAQVPAVQEHFGPLTGVGMDWGAMTANPGTMVLKLTGAKGEGRLLIQTDPATMQFRSATLTLPNGEVHELDTAELRQLQALQQGQWPLPLP